MGEATTWSQFRESIGTICIGIVVAIIIVLFLMRMQDWTITALESIIVLIFGLGAMKAFKFSDEQNTFFYPVGLFCGIILCAVTLISPYGDDLIRWSTIQTGPAVTVTQTLNTVTASAVPTIIPTASPTVALTMPTIAATGTFAPTTVATVVSTTGLTTHPTIALTMPIFSPTGTFAPTTIATAVPTTVATTVPTIIRTTAPVMTPTPTPAIAVSQVFTPGWIVILVIVFLIAVIIAYLLETRKLKK